MSNFLFLSAFDKSSVESASITAYNPLIKKGAVVARALADQAGNSEQISGIVHIEAANQATIMTDTGPRTLPVNSVVFGTRNYSRDFVKAYGKYYSDLMGEFNLPVAQRKLIPMFEKAV